MAVDPQFAATPVAGAAVLTAAETALGGGANPPTASQLLITAGANGTKIEEIDIICVTTTTANLAAISVAGLVYLFLYDGTTYHLRDTIPITAITASATVAPFQASRTYTNLWYPTGWSLRVSMSVAQGTNSGLKVIAFGGNY